MQNPLSFLSSLTGAAPLNNAKSAATQPPAAPFNQFLSREMASRPAAAPMPAQANGKLPASVQTVTPQRAQPAPAAPKQPQQAQQAGAQAAGNQANDGAAQAEGENAAAPVAKADAAADAAPADVGTDTGAATAADQADSDADAAASVPVDLLALVASFNQAAAPADRQTQADAADAPAIAIDADAGRRTAAADPRLAAGQDMAAQDTAGAAADAIAGQAAAADTAAPATDNDFAAALASLTGKAKDAAPVQQTDAAQAVATPVEARDVPAAALAAVAAPAQDQPAIDKAPALPGADAQAEQPVLAESRPVAVKTEQPAAQRTETGAQAAQLAAQQDAAPNPALVAAQAGAERQAAAPVTPANTPQLSEVGAAGGANGAQAAQVQHAAFAAAQGPNDPAADKLSPPVGTPAWDQAVGQKVVWMVAGGQQSATLTLNPPDLGPLQVVVNVSNDQASADFSSNAPEVRAALEAAMPKLRDMLNDAGIQLGSSSVGTGLPNQQMAQDQQNQPRAQRVAESTVRADEADVAVRAGAPRQTRAAVGLVDTFV
jgi:flagellar hook-length control protein FliK